ncbi:MAG TPA: stage II sporulation protein R [Firmicutes bacterium]|nr:stage II sporulation protein R [Bacillota bacterium]
MARGGLASLLILAILVGLWGYSAHSEPDLIRLHVVANSDSPDDQALKLSVRDEVLKILGAELSQVRTRREAETVVRRYLGDVRSRVKEVIVENGCDPNTPVRVELGHYQFPVRTYGELVLPAGRYEALRVVIGDGNGQNWWCVLFPPLCYLGITGKYTIDPEKVEVLRRSLEMAYSGKTSPRNLNPPEDISLPEVRLAILEWLGKNDFKIQLGKLFSLLSRLHL